MSSSIASKNTSFRINCVPLSRMFSILFSKCSVICFASCCYSAKEKHIALAIVMINPFFISLKKCFNLDSIRATADCFVDFVCPPAFVNDLDAYNSTRIFLFTYKRTANIALFWYGHPFRCLEICITLI